MVVYSVSVCRKQASPVEPVECFARSPREKRLEVAVVLGAILVARRETLKGIFVMAHPDPCGRGRPGESNLPKDQRLSDLCSPKE